MKRFRGGLKINMPNPFFEQRRPVVLEALVFYEGILGWRRAVQAAFARGEQQSAVRFEQSATLSNRFTDGKGSVLTSRAKMGQGDCLFRYRC